PRRVPGEKLSRTGRRGAPGRGLFFEPSAEELELLTETELADGAIGGGSLAEVAAPRGRLELVVPLGPELRELPLGAALRERGGLGGGLGEGHSGVGRRAHRLDRAASGADVTSGGPGQTARALLLQDVRRPAGHAA